MEVVDVLVNGVMLVLGGFLGKGVDWVLARGKVDVDKAKAATDAMRVESEVGLSESDKATQLQREIIADLRKEIAELVSLLRKLEDERLECKVENATLKAELKALKEKLEELEAELKAATQK